MINYKQGLMLFLASWSVASIAANKGPCVGPYALLGLVNRPSSADSPCAAPPHEFILEQGYQSLKLIGGGRAQIFPWAQLRFGLTQGKELFLWVPTYIKENATPRSGFSAMALGYKQVIKSSSNWMFTLDGFVTPPSGSRTFGSKGEGVLNGIFYYAINSKLSLVGQLGLSTQTDSPINGGKRYNSVNPDVLMSYALSNTVQLYGEVNGQTKTASNRGSGYDAAAVFLFLISKDFMIDVEAGQRLRGALDGLENYVGAGMAIQFP
ncbi:MAG: transporter [Tatlockia sp.]|jgi:hypothetical protein